MKVRMLYEDGQPIVDVSYTYGSRLIEQRKAELVDADAPVTPVTPAPDPISARFEENEAAIAQNARDIDSLEGRMTYVESADETALGLHVDADGYVYQALLGDDETET